MSELIKQGESLGYIKIDSETNYITYLHQNKRRNFNNPEEKIQAQTFLKLILEYKYPVENIEMFVTVQMGVAKKEADIIVYNDKEHLSPYIVVECKKEEISELEFKTAVNQAFSYAVTEGAKFVWTTSGIKDECYQVPKKKPKDRITIVDIPLFGEKFIPKFKYVKGDPKFHD